jgi:hypothetical protein
MMADQPTLQELVAKREFACRLALEHSLATLEEAEAFLLDRGMLTLTPDCALPSLFGACHEAPASGGAGIWRVASKQMAVADRACRAPWCTAPQATSRQEPLPLPGTGCRSGPAVSRGSGTSG